jgi:CRISPR/Cas system-associated protein Cas10 (large subunit of type III CRISPR-Cas system)
MPIIVDMDPPEYYDGSEDQLDRYIAQRRGKDCDLCGEPFDENGGPHDGGDDGSLCTACRDWEPEEES